MRWAKRISEALPYIESGQVTRKLPSGFSVELTEAEVIGAVKRLGDLLS